MDYGNIQPRRIVEEMQESYLDYSMSVIVSRALPDARDGMKPVHRRILYAMWDIGLRASAKYRKSATVVGEVLGKYHPHGDQAVYDSMVRMAQDFSMRELLVDGQGNFGSMDGDGAAAMRYTEAKLTKAAEQLLIDLEKNTVDWRPNYDNTQQEPTALPAKLPNLLLNGGVGIAVGMATSIPPHNLNELCDAAKHLIEHPDATTEDLMQFVTGPDFPTGGIIFDKNEIKQAYATGRGGIVTRAKTDIVEVKDGYFNIIVTEIPYMVNKAALLEKIATLVKDKKIDGIKDLRDESDKEGVRIVIELKKEAFPKKVLNRLFSLTQLQNKFSVNLLALVDRGRQPQVMTLVTALQAYIEHRQEVIRRRTQFDLDRAEERAHILEGLKIAQDAIDAVIKLIRGSKTREEAHKGLMTQFKLSDIQANAILDMRLAQLTALDRLKIENELKEKYALIKELKAILADEQKVFGIIKDDLEEMKEQYGTERRTQVMAGAAGEFAAEDLIPDENVVISLTQSGYIKSLEADTYKAQGRGGKGVKGMETKEEDVVQTFFATSSHSDLLFFTSKGRVFQTKAYEIPKSSRTAKGNSIVNFLQLSQDEHVNAVLPLANFSEDVKYLTLVSRQGLVKRTPLSEFENVRRSGLIAASVKDGDELAWVRPTHGDDEILIVSTAGQAIRFKEKDVRSMGRTAAGVRGLKLKAGDEVVGMAVITKKVSPDTCLMVITEKGFGKKTRLDEYRQQGRGGSGIKTASITAKNGPIVSARLLSDAVNELIVISKAGQVIRVEADVVRESGRSTQGVRVMRLKNNDTISSVALVTEPDVVNDEA
ncbi:MAG: DNA gyrase subunit A [Candidatus Doudnabacteria bacterium]|nr:DNA gyrase subunit A [Candidatus Doudnabacteria bacterium]